VTKIYFVSTLSWCASNFCIDRLQTQTINNKSNSADTPESKKSPIESEDNSKKNKNGDN